MGVYIKDMDMPTKCADCGFCANGGEHETDFCRVQLEPCECVIGGMMWKEVKSNEIDKGCPLVEVKEPHGRLTDEDEVLDTVKRLKSLPWGDDRGNRVPLLFEPCEVERVIKQSPTVIEGSR